MNTIGEPEFNTMSDENGIPLSFSRPIKSQRKKYNISGKCSPFMKLTLFIEFVVLAKIHKKAHY